MLSRWAPDTSHAWRWALPGPNLYGLIRSISSLRGPLDFEPSIPAHSGLRYATRRSRRHTAPRVDVYLPDGSGPHPSVVLVHGGAFLIGSRSMKPMRVLCTALVEAGYAVASVDYRTIGRGGSGRAGVDDVREAIAWWRGEARRFGLDLSRVGVIGLSAGATLALLATEDASVDDVRSRVALFGLYDFGTLDGALARAIRILLLRGSDPRSLSPRWSVSSPAPLTLLHGTDDLLVPAEQAHQYAMVRRAAGLPVEVHLIDGAPHGFLNTPGEHADTGVRLVLEALARDLRSED